MPVKLIILFLLFSTVAPAQTTIVYFDFESTQLTKDTRNILDKLIASKKINSLGITGHTDQMGSNEYNEWLSILRARAVKDYLLSKGLDNNKISVVRGFGAQRLVTDKLDDFSRKLNRRAVLYNNYTPTPSDAATAVRQAGMEKPATLDTLEPTLNKDLTRKEPATTPVEVVQEEPKTKTPPVIEKRIEPIVKQQQNEKLIEDIKDKNTKAGENIALKNINFVEGSHQFLPIAARPLEDLLETMQKVPTLEIEIQGHVCCQDGDMDALDNATGEQVLSVNRAKAVYDFLVEKGINKDRLSYRGLAHKFPLIKIEVTEADRVTNRRVEIKIIKK